MSFKEPTSLLVAGDIHGDVDHVEYLFREAVENLNVDAILNVGDMGFWEHSEGGVAFLDVISDLAMQNDMPFYWIDGNHENHTLLRANYGPGGAKHKPTPEGFWEIRPGLFYIPRGTRWEWNGAKIMGLGGAYSVDKDYRLARENGEVCTAWGWTARHVAQFGALGKGTMWWPEEEITDEEISNALVDDTPLDVLFTHDKPRTSNPQWNRKDLPECYPNQDRIQTVIRTLTPRLLVHGHLHTRYQDAIRCGDDDKMTHVVGLDCNPELVDHRSMQPRPVKVVEQERKNSWVRLSLDLPKP